MPTGRTHVGRYVHHIAELSVGAGIIQNLTELYRFLMHHYEPDDKIFLFGFSRGAFTVRALAGLLHTCGLIRPDDEQLLPHAIGLYQTSESRIRAERKKNGLPKKFAPDDTDHTRLDRAAQMFKSTLAQECKIKFLGVWDTVKAYGWFYRQSFPSLRHNPSVEAVRHAVALHERRAVFQMTGWGERHEGVKEVWFTGDHSDVGGGHEDGNSSLADATLCWMLGEATHSGLLIDITQKSAIEDMTERSRKASIRAPHDLLKRGWRLAIPLTELDNSEYPPSRKLKLSPQAPREPARHDEHTGRLLFHHSVVERVLSTDITRNHMDDLVKTLITSGDGGKFEVLPEHDKEIIGMI